MLSFLNRDKPLTSDEEAENKEDVDQLVANKPPPRLVVNASGQLDPSLLKRVDGFMYKKGGAVNARGGRRNWKKRWFVLNEYPCNWGVGYELKYYENSNNTGHKGTVDLTDVEIFCEARSLHKRVKYEFQILLQNGNALQLSCDTAQEHEEWLQTLNMVVAYTHKMRNSAAASFNLDGYDPLLEDDEEVYKIGAAIALNCQAFGAGLFGAEAGQHGQFIVQINDTLGQRVTRGGMPITATISNGECLYYLRVHDNRDGSYFMHYMLYKPGKYTLAIRLNDEHDIFGSPYTMQIMPSKTIPDQCVAFGECLAYIHTNTTSTFTIQARDIFGNNKTRGGDPFELGVMGPATLDAMEDNGDGTYTCRLEAQSPADATHFTSSTLLILVTLHGKHIAGSPFNATIVEDTPSPDVSQFIQPPSQQQQQQGKAQLKAPSPYGSPTAISATMTAHPETKAQAQRPQSKPQKQQQIQQPPSPAGSDLPPPPPPAASAALRRTPSPAAQSTSSTPPGSGAGTLEHSQGQWAGVHAGVSASASASATAGPPPGRPMANPVQPQPQPQHQQPPQPAIKVPQYTPEEFAAMGRLEKAKLRALQAQAQAQAQAQSQQGRPSSTSPPLNSTPAAAQAPAPADTAAARTSFNPKLTNLQKLAVANAGGEQHIPTNAGGGGKLGHALRQQQQQQQQHKQQGGGHGPQHSISAHEVKQIMDALRGGLAGSYVPAAGGGSVSDASRVEEAGAWTITHQALMKPEVLSLLGAHINELKSSFDLIAESLSIPGFTQHIKVVRLMQHTSSSSSSSSTPTRVPAGGNNMGVYRLLEEFDVIAAYASKKEVKMLFGLIYQAQRNSNSILTMTGREASSTSKEASYMHYLDFISFVRLLVMVAMYALTRSAGMNAVYVTAEAKVEVLLLKWGLADTNKIAMVGRQLAASAASSAGVSGSRR